MITVSTLVPYLAGALVAGGIAVAVSRRRDMIHRWCAWAVGIPVVTGAFWLGPPGAAVIAAVAAVWLAPLAAMVPLGAITLLIFAAVSVGDIAAYVAGRRFGGPPLSPLSPAKRWSGTLAGAIAAAGALAVFDPCACLRPGQRPDHGFLLTVPWLRRTGGQRILVEDVQNRGACSDQGPAPTDGRRTKGRP
jgi:CDP-diglyceride synthetase